MPRPKPILLLILDGWGHRMETENNAIALAHCPNWRQLLAKYPHSLVQTHGAYVGLPDDQMGNSEVGHMNIGAGRIVYQDLTRIDAAIADGSFFQNAALLQGCNSAKSHTLHVFGLLSSGGVHSHENHIFALLDLAAQQGVQRIAVHVFLDGRDTPPQSAEPSIRKLMEKCAAISGAFIASVSGRYYAMDRDKRWDRVALAYNAIAEAHSPFQSDNPLNALFAAYKRDESDEFVKPTTIGKGVKIADGDAIIFMNFRADRARELTQVFMLPDFNEFSRQRFIKLSAFVTLTQYGGNFLKPSRATGRRGARSTGTGMYTEVHEDSEHRATKSADCAAGFKLPVTAIAYPPQSMHNTLPEYLANLGMTQLRIAETEKYAHVTFFFSVGREEPFPGEQRVLVPSPKVATYDLQPEMSCPELTDKLVVAIQSGQFNFIVCNIANPDMVGHTGKLNAAIKAVEAVDVALGRIYSAISDVGGEMLITADHGNLENMLDENNQPHTQHTVGPVPLVYVGRKAKLMPGSLCDLAPTVLALMNLPKPTEMTGKNLVEFLS